MATGKNGTVKWSSSNGWASVGVDWTETYDASKNQSTVSITGVYANVTAYSGVTYYPDLKIQINGTTAITMNSNLGTHYVYISSTSTWCAIKTSDGASSTGSVTVTHSADGSSSVNITITGNRYTNSGFYTIDGGSGNGWSVSGSQSITLTTIPTYTLSLSAGTGSSITVSRTSSGYASKGTLSNGARLYTSDTLKITFTASTNYAIATHTVNGSTFTSGGTHTVSGNVTVVSTATLVKSTIGATDANIGSTSTITITRYNSSYTHTITYKLGSATGTVATKDTRTSIAWTVPTAFYAQIPNAKTGTCTLTCETFNGSTSLGTNTCTLTVTASSSACAPTVSGTVVDTNTATVALTGNSSTLIRYKSTAQCTITATALNSATISSKYINDVAPTNDVRTISGVSTTSFVFKATDSRGYTTSKTVTPTMIAYIALTCNPILSRVTPTGGDVVLTFTGAYYKGSFGAYSNTLTIRYRYKLSTDSTWGSWITVPSTSYTIGTSSYSTSSAISLGSDFDYQQSYNFQVQAYDGANGTTLTSVTKSLTLQRGIPVFDWGENDFAFHVPIKIGDTQLTEAQLIKLLALIT